MIGTDSIDKELEYYQGEPCEFLLNVNDAFTTKIGTTKPSENRSKEVQFTLEYYDLMGRKYRQLFVFYYGFPNETDAYITRKYMWECIKDIEFK